MKISEYRIQLSPLRLASVSFIFLSALLVLSMTALPYFSEKFNLNLDQIHILSHMAIALLSAGLLYLLLNRHISSHQKEIDNLNRLYRVISNINQTIVHESSREKMFQSACDIAVFDGGFSMAWIGLLQEDGRLLPVCQAGNAGNYLEHLHINLNDAQGPTVRALLEGHIVVCSDIANDPRMLPWREQALAHGFAASAAVPLRIDGVTLGAFNLYTKTAGEFNRQELELLDEIARDIAFACDFYAKREASKAALTSQEENRQKLVLALESANLGMWDVNLEAGEAIVNENYFTMLGLPPQPTASLDWWFERMHPEDRADVRTSMQLQLKKNHPRLGVEYRIRHSDGSWRWLVGIGSIVGRSAEGVPTRIIGVNLDITDRIRAEHEREQNALRAEGLLSLATAEASMGEKELLQYGLDLAERITDSKIGFLHLVNEDQQTIELAAWSTATHRHCTAAFDQHYPIAQAGIWADCFHTKTVVICNNYQDAANKKGLPEGHFPLSRFISLPAITSNKVQMIMGVGNREEDYTAHDAETLQLIANDLWRIVQRRRAEASLRQNVVQQQALIKKLEDAHNQLLQSEKLAAIGQLAAGVAHELNNPIGFVHSNLGALEGYVNDLMEITDAWKALKERMGQNCPQTAQVETLMQIKDYDYIRTDLPQLINESKEGLSRVRRIVQDLKDFSRAGESTWEWADLHKGLDSTLNIVWNELKYKCVVHKEYSEIPMVYCLSSQLNQVFMNLLVNASHAIDKHGDITIRTGTEREHVWIEIADTGKGIPPEIIGKIFDPFFTTKPVGQGTGLGLSLSYSIMQRHHGCITAQSKVGQGTTFRIELPIQPQNQTTPPAVKEAI